MEIVFFSLLWGDGIFCNNYYTKTKKNERIMYFILFFWCFECFLWFFWMSNEKHFLFFFCDIIKRSKSCIIFSHFLKMGMIWYILWAIAIVSFRKSEFKRETKRLIVPVRTHWHPRGLPAFHAGTSVSPIHFPCPPNARTTQIKNVISGKREIV